jgi:hypothetical protein
MERSHDFREGLRRELPVWQAEGIVTPGAARALGVRYDLDGPDVSYGSTGERCGSVASATGVGVLCTLAAALAGRGLEDGALLPVAALGAAFAAAPLAARGEALAPAAAALRSVGRVAFYLAAWGFSFVALADALRFRSVGSPGLLAALPALLLALAAVLLGLHRNDVDAHARGEAMLLVATVLAFVAGLFLETGTGTAVVANLALAFLAAGRIVRGLSWLTRGPFWEGLLVAAVLVLSRIPDVTTSGWARAAGAVLVTAAVASAGLLFERRRSRAPGARVHAT